MSKIILLQGYSNFFNRLVKIDSTIAAYKTYTYVEVEANFNPADGVNTDHVFNATSISPDYLVVTDGDNIVSRWYVMEWSRTRAGQYKATLKRDVKADFYQFYANAPAYIEKAMLPFGSPLIFNSEGGSYNQIKQSETLIGDQGRWIVGYLSKDAGQLTGVVNTDGEYLEINTTMANWEFNQANYNGALKNVIYKTRYTYVISTTSVNMEWQPYFSNTSYAGSYMQTRQLQSAVNDAMAEAYDSTALLALDTALISSTGTHTAAKEAELLEYSGKIVKDTDNRLWSVFISSDNVSYNGKAPTSVNTLMQALAESTEIFTRTTDDDDYRTSYDYKQYHVTVSELSTGTYTTSANRWKCNDSPLYDLFCIPYDPLIVYGEVGKTDVQFSVQLATSLATNATAAKCFDVQLLPYCPIQDYVIAMGNVALAVADEGKGWQKIKDTNNKLKTIILYPTKSNISFRIDQSIDCASNAIDRKVNSECDVWRMVSPNGAGAFEFSPEKNNGVIGFDVDITYKPYNPYIHIAPAFNGLYGQDFNDFRGLTLGGDYSFGTLNSAWANYELSNKNYQATFNRSVEHMDYNHKLQMLQSGLGAVASAVNVGVSAASMSPMGAAGAGLASIGAGIADQVLLQKQHNEASDYQKDIFQFQLGNIKAMPTTISKSSALVSNNKKLPYLEYFTATDDEKAALRNNITYSSMSVGTIGTIASYQTGSRQFIKAVLVMLPDIKEDTHMAQELYTELAKGAYFF